jgi:hypothetical protein
MPSTNTIGKKTATEAKDDDHTAPRTSDVPRSTAVIGSSPSSLRL